MTDNELLLAISKMIDDKLEPIKEDIEQIKEDTTITRSATNHIGDCFEKLVDVLEETGVIAPHTINY